MQRGKWSELSGDSDIWKKIAVGGAGLLLVLPIPLALGMVFEDLDTELTNIKSKKPPGKLTDIEAAGSLFAKGLAPAFIFVLSLMLFCLPSIVVLMSSAQTYAWIVSEHGMNWLSFLVTAAFGLIALAVQFLVALVFPVALTQYARGLSLKAAMDPIGNMGLVFEYGSELWNKAAGYWLFLIGSMVLTILGWNFWLDLIVRFGLCALGFASLVVSCRFILARLSA